MVTMDPCKFGPWKNNDAGQITYWKILQKNSWMFYCLCTYSICTVRNYTGRAWAAYMHHTLINKLLYVNQCCSVCFALVILKRSHQGEDTRPNLQGQGLVVQVQGKGHRPQGQGRHLVASGQGQGLTSLEERWSAVWRARTYSGPNLQGSELRSDWYS